MGQVYLAQQLNLNRLVVIKRVVAERTGAHAIRALLEEARVAARLHHPNVVSVLDVSHDGESPFIAMEYLSGVTLRDMIERSSPGAVPLEVALVVTLDLLRGLSYAHGVRTGQHMGVVHRDVKPRNVMVTFAGVSKLIDFGISRWLDDETAAGLVMGTRGYMAPEQHKAGARIDGRADQHAVAITLYEMVTGAMPLVDDATLGDTPNAVAAFEPRVPIEPELGAIITKSLSVEPDDRYPDCDAMADALEALARKRGLVLSATEVHRWLRDRFAQEYSAEEQESASLAEVSDAQHETRVGGPATAPTNLAPPPDRFVGRAVEQTSISERFNQGARLITLLGPPGIGKTRLSREYGWLVREGYPGGVWFIDLTEARTVDGVLVGIASALSVGGLAATVDGMVKQLGAAITHRGHALFVLDNFEQVANHATATIGRLGDLAPDARWLVTSRERLNMPGEGVIDVGPLATGMDANGALALLIDRASAARPGLPLGRAEIDDLGAVVDRLEGNPLAIELAAGRLKVLSPHQLRERLAQGFDVLTGRRRGVPERQTAFDKAIEWSWQMLEPAERATLAQAAIFRSGFSVEAAEAVIDLEGYRDIPVIDALESLCDKSLLRRVVSLELPDEPRFGMYEGIRSFALAKLDALGMANGAHKRHADYYLAYAEAWAAEDCYPRVRERARHLASERENVWALVEPSLEPGGATEANVVLALRAVATLVSIYEGWALRSLFARAFEVLLESEHAAAAPPVAQAIAWRERSRVALRNQTELMWKYTEKSIAIAREHRLAESFAWGVFRALPILSDLHDITTTRALLAEAMQWFTSPDDRDWRTIATVLAVSFQKIQETDPGQLDTIIDQLMVTSRVSQRPGVLAQIHWALGVHFVVKNELAASMQHFMRVVALYEETGDDQSSLALARGNVAAISLLLDRDLEAALRMAELSRRSLLEMGLPTAVAFNDFNLCLIREGLGDMLGAEIEARRCLDRQTAAGSGSNWLLRGDAGRVAAAGQLAIVLSQLDRVDDAEAMIAEATTWTTSWSTNPPSSESVMAAAYAILDLARAHCALGRGVGELTTATQWLDAARGRSDAAWSDEVQVILRRTKRRIEDSVRDSTGGSQPGGSHSSRSGSSSSRRRN
jgi:serine/threonine protein kinase